MSGSRRHARKAWAPVLLAAIATVLALATFSGHARAEPGYPVATAARLEVEGEHTRFILEVDRAIEANVFPLADPERIVIDLPEIAFRLPESAGREGRGLVSAFRYGLFMAGRSRIVIDASGPVKVAATRIEPPQDGGKGRLTVDLVATDRESFLADVSAHMAEATASARRTQAPAAPIKRADGKLVVVIDPGHGGIDSGTIGRDGMPEKTVVLDFAKVLAARLAASGRYDVHLTREDDRFLPLAARVALARDLGADLMISVHADSLSDRSFRGASVYTLSETPSDHDAAALAAKENNSDLLAGLPIDNASDMVAGILMDLAQRETKAFSVRFARTLVDALKGTTKLVPRPHREAGLRVLRAPDVPSVLVELGYLSNADDEKLLLSEEWQARTAEAMVKAVDAFFRRRTAEIPKG